MFQQMMASLLGTKRQLEGGRVLRREGSAPAGFSKLGRLLQPLLRASVAVAAFVVLPAQAAGLNDTGITICGNASTSSANCATESADSGSFPRQDARYGRDAQSALGMLTKVGGGSSGFDFSRITNTGAVNNAAPLGPGDAEWACTRDNVTGLTWEVKTESGLRNKTHTYSLYQGGLGVANGGSCTDGTGCDTTKFVADVNAAHLCGYTDWRMPTLKELENIVDFSRINPPIDPDYFRNTAVNQYWSSTADSSYSPGQYFWLVDFYTGAAAKDQPKHPQAVRLVRGTAPPTNQFQRLGWVAGIEVGAEDLDGMEYTGGAFDLGEALAQDLALAVDPFATGPAAERARQEAGLAGEAVSGPFAALAALKGKSA